MTILGNFRTGNAVALAICLTIGTGAAATLDVDADGQLQGATGITVGGELYDVAFVDGTCDERHNTCAAGAPQTFNTLEEANAASQALLDTVYSGGNFSGSPQLTNGIAIGEPDSYIYTIYAITTATIDVSVLRNHQASSLDAVRDPLSLPVATDTSLFDDAVWAVWSLAETDPEPDPDTSPVPLPAGGMLMLSGLAGVAALRRRKRRTA